MKNCTAIFILFIAVLISCENSNGPTAVNQNPRPGTPIDTTIQEAVIDTSDLYYLPEDTGGTHKAYPLGSTSAWLGYYIYTPGGYSDDGPGYPLIVSLHGAGESGDSSEDEEVIDDLLNSGLPELINLGNWNPKYPFIVVSPQVTSTELWPPHQIHSFIEFIIDNYQINTSRIYLTGYSLGGGGCWLYAGGVEDHYAAAIVPISSSGLGSLAENLSDVPIWAFHGETDELVEPFENFGSVEMVQLVNRTNPSIRAKVTVYPNVGHNAWTRTYNGTGIKQPYWYDNYNMNIYEWMLQFRKDQSD